MAEIDHEFTALMKRVRAGSEEAAAMLLDRYGPVIQYAVRRRLNRQMRSKFDSMDFVQDVWTSFFANLPTEHEFSEPRFLVAFLTTIAKHKVADATRKRMIGKKHNVNREHSLESSLADNPNLLAANQPTPSAVVTRREEWDKFLDALPLVYRKIFISLRDGRKPQEIADELGIHVRSVNRIVAKLVSRPKA